MINSRWTCGSLVEVSECLRPLVVEFVFSMEFYGGFKRRKLKSEECDTNFPIECIYVPQSLGYLTLDGEVEFLFVSDSGFWRPSG